MRNQNIDLSFLCAILCTVVVLILAISFIVFVVSKLWPLFFLALVIAGIWYIVHKTRNSNRR